MSTSTTPTSVRAALALGASMRLTRFVVADDVPGQWWIKDPLDRRIEAHLEEHGLTRDDVDGRWEELPITGAVVEKSPAYNFVPWWLKYREGLDCPYCVGQWIAGAVVVSERLTRHTRWAGAWTLVASALTLNEVAAHLGARLGDTASNDED